MKPARFKSARGGRGSSKSHTFAQFAIFRMAGLMPGYPEKPVRIASARQFQTAIKESVKQAVEKYIHVLGLSDQFNVKSYEIDHRNGSRMIFPGFDRNPESLMSIEGIDVLWVEQAETLTDEMTLIEPSIREPGSELWFTWNPKTRTGWCWQRFVENPRPGDVSALVNYHDNPWFPKELEDQRAIDEEIDPDQYVHVWLGEPDDGDADLQVLPYKLIKQCVKAYEEDLAPPAVDAPLIDIGFDIAEGGRDKCSVMARRGPVLFFGDLFPGVVGDLSVAAGRAHRAASMWDTWRLNYDGSSPMAREFREFDPPYQFRAHNFGGKVLGPEVTYERSGSKYRTNEEMFRALNIQMATNLRLRAQRTVKLRKGDKSIDPVNCLFIAPDLFQIHDDEFTRHCRLERFLSEMTQPIRRQSPQTGKWELDKRGDDEDAKSPDNFDASCLAFVRDCERLRAA